MDSSLSFKVWRCSDRKIKVITALTFTSLTIGADVALVIVSVSFSTPIYRQVLSIRFEFIFAEEKK